MTIDSVGRKNCSGCSLCSLICPHNSITMQGDMEGFLQPVIDHTSCVECGLCYKMCPCKGMDEVERHPVYYSSAIKDKPILKKSSSGGVFYALASSFITRGGYVCGCVFNEDLVAQHICTNNMEDIKRMMGSKYVQSNIRTCLPVVNTYLAEGYDVLFTGTACQIAAAKQFVKNSENLYCVDVLCHGVPSPMYFRKYVDYLQTKHKGKLHKIEFRNKGKRGWGAEHRTYYEINRNGRIKGYRPFLPSYFCAFFWGINLRESCYNCKFTGTNRVSDITIGDFWGSWNYFKKMFTEGISIASVNTVRGKILFDNIRSELDYCYELPQKDALGSNTNFYHPTVKPSTRDSFYDRFEEKSYRQMRSSVFFNKATRRQLLVSLYGFFAPEFVKRIKRTYFRKDG